MPTLIDIDVNALTPTDVQGASISSSTTLTSTNGATTILSLSPTGIAAGQLFLYGMSGTITYSGTDHVQFGNGVDVHASDWSGGSWSISGTLLYKNSSGDCYVEDRFLAKAWTDIELNSFSAVTTATLSIEAFGAASVTINAGYIQQIKS